MERTITRSDEGLANQLKTKKAAAENNIVETDITPRNQGGLMLKVKTSAPVATSPRHNRSLDILNDQFQPEPNASNTPKAKKQARFDGQEEE